MRFGLTTALVLALLFAGAAWAQQVPEAKVIPPDWPEEQTFEFAIFNSAGARVATAYYRILQAENEGRPVYWLKYVGRNEQMSEATECWVRRDNLQPIRSTRKLVSGRTEFLDIAYSDGVILLRKKLDDGPVYEREIPAPTRHFDYEQLMWLIPQLDFQGSSRVHFNLFANITENQASVIVTDVGPQPLNIDGVEYQAHHYAFDVNLMPYMLWTVMQDGRPVVAKLNIGSTSFVNMRLDPQKAGAAPAQAVPPEQAAPPQPKQPEQKPEPKPEEPTEPTDPNVNPLGPPPPGGRF